MAGVALVVTHRLLPGHEDAFDALTLTTLESIRALETDTLVYAVHTTPGEPLERVFYELYRDRAAFEAHEAFPHLRTFLAERPAHIESVEVTFLDLQAVAGVGAASV